MGGQTRAIAAGGFRAEDLGCHRSGDRRSKGPRFCAKQTKKTPFARKAGGPIQELQVLPPSKSRQAVQVGGSRPAVCAEILTKRARMSSK